MASDRNVFAWTALTPMYPPFVCLNATDSGYELIARSGPDRASMQSIVDLDRETLQRLRDAITRELGE